MMDYDKLKEMLTNPNSKIWIQGKKVGTASGADIWEYEFGGLGLSRVVARGVESNNPQIKFASGDFGIFVDGKKLDLDRAQYSELFGQMGYLFSVVQPAKLKQQTQNR